MTRPVVRRRRANNVALIPAVLAMLALLAVLPSSLRLPTAEPTETLEFAPVVPQDDEDLASNVLGGRLGLASGAAGDLGQSASDSTPLNEILPARGQGKDPSTKRCVGNPPLQTEDPISPPCVAHFSGDNFGSTYLGVTGDEVRVLVYLYGAFSSGRTSQGSEPRSCGRYIDLAQPPEEDEFIQERMLRAYQRYFNDRYQTYGRFVHFYAYPTCSPEPTPENRRADAAANRAAVKPFAVISNGVADYDLTMARYGILSFGVGSKPAKFYESQPPLLWGFDATTESRARVLGAYFCQKVVPHPVSFSGNGDLGSSRRLGLLVATDPDSQALAALVTERVNSCGGRIWVKHNYTSYEGPTEVRPTQEGIAKMGEFQANGVTTVLYVGGPNFSMSNSAASIGYEPEIVVADPREIFTRNFNGSMQHPSVWRHAWTVTTLPKIGPMSEEYCYLAAKEANVERTQPEDYETWQGCRLYQQVQQLFTAIQVAGPRLTPSNVAGGFRAIPGVPSGNPRRPACFYPADDYTCVKDATTAWWDGSGDPPNGAGNPGCWRLAEAGRRYLESGWSRSDANAVKNPAEDVCNGW